MQNTARWIHARKRVSRTYLIIKVVTRVRERSRFFKLENLMNSRKPYFITWIAPWDAMAFPWPQALVTRVRERSRFCADNMVDTYWTLDANDRNGWTFLQNRPSHQSSLAPLICRVVRAVRVRGRWAWIPGRARSVFFPNLRLTV